MVFSSLLFIFKFLPIALISYFITPRKYKNLILLLLSLFFYSWGEPKYFPIMISSIIVDYSISIIIDNNRRNKILCRNLLLLSLTFNLGILFFFKYSNFFINNINNIFNVSISKLNLTLPLGISFYTFQTLSYTIDVYKGKIPAEKNIINFAAFVSLFPQLIAGPIVKYTDVNKQLNSREISLDKIEDGIRHFILGLGKKVIIANNVGMLWNEVQQIGFSNISTPLAWLGIIAFALQIYFDFSGYSSMAIGLGKMLGFDFPKNFDYPYISRSITEFWRRWHITLGSWFKEYVFIPLGGSRVSSWKLYLNLFIVWFLTGFWHGANYNFILWGMFFFIIISFEKSGLLNLLNKYKILSHIYTIILLLIGWSIFAIIDIQELYLFFNRLFVFRNGVEWLYYLRNYLIILLIGCIFSTPFVENIYNKYIVNKWIDALILLFIFLISISYLVDSTYNPFLYFNF